MKVTVVIVLHAVFVVVACIPTAIPISTGQLSLQQRYAYGTNSAPASEEPIFLVTNIDNPYQACRCNRQRFRIETFFSNQKRKGFHTYNSHLADPVHPSRLLIAAHLAYI